MSDKATRKTEVIANYPGSAMVLEDTKNYLI
jgi:hypothetical protein